RGSARAPARRNDPSERSGACRRRRPARTRPAGSGRAAPASPPAAAAGPAVPRARRAAREWGRSGSASVAPQPAGEIRDQARGAVERRDDLAHPLRVGASIAAYRPPQGLHQPRTRQVLGVNPPGQPTGREGFGAALLLHLVGPPRPARPPGRDSRHYRCPRSPRSTVRSAATRARAAARLGRVLVDRGRRTRSSAAWAAPRPGCRRLPRRRTAPGSRTRRRRRTDAPTRRRPPTHATAPESDRRRP